MPALARLTLLALTLLAAPALDAQAVHGRLTDAQGRTGLAGGTISVVGRDGVVEARAETDSTGAFRLGAPRPGGYRLRAERAGFRTAESNLLELAESDTIEVEFRLSPRVVLLEPLVVRSSRNRAAGPLRGFYDRMDRKAGGGRFLSRAAIERRRPVFTSDLLRTIPGIRIFPGRFGRSGAILLRDCAPRLYLDGIRVRSPGVTVDELASPFDLEGVEVYGSSSEIPVEYQSADSTCGAIFLWTRIE